MENLIIGLGAFIIVSIILLFLGERIKNCAIFSCQATYSVVCTVYSFFKGLIYDIKNTYDYYFKQEKELISGKKIRVFTREYVSPSMISGSITELETNIETKYKVAIKKNDGKMVFVVLKKELFPKLGIENNSFINNLPCVKCKADDSYEFDYDYRELAHST